MSEKLNTAQNQEKMEDLIHRVEKCIEQVRQRKEARQKKELREQVEKVANG